MNRWEEYDAEHERLMRLPLTLRERRREMLKAFSLGQRIAIRSLARALRKHPRRREELQAVIGQSFPRRTRDEHERMWQAVLDYKAWGLKRI